MCIRLNIEKRAGYFAGYTGAAGRDELNFMEEHLFGFTDSTRGRNTGTFESLCPQLSGGGSWFFAAGEIRRMVMDEACLIKTLP